MRTLRGTSLQTIDLQSGDLYSIDYHPNEVLS